MIIIKFSNNICLQHQQFIKTKNESYFWFFKSDNLVLGG